MKYRNDLINIEMQKILKSSILRSNISYTTFNFNNTSVTDILSDSLEQLHFSTNINFLGDDIQYNLGSAISHTSTSLAYNEEASNTESFQEITVFGDVKYKQVDNMIISGGLKTGYITTGEHLVFNPSLSAKYFTENESAYELSYSSSSQKLSSVWNSDFPMPFDFYVVSEENISCGNEISLSYQKWISDEYFFRTESFIGYYTGLNNSPLSGVLFDSESETGEMRAKGLEFLFKKTEGKLTGFASYSLLHSQEIFDQGQWQAGRFDRTHSLYLQLNWRWLRLSMEYGTGFPKVDASERLPDFFSLNVISTLDFNLFGGRLGAYLEITNITNLTNIVWSEAEESKTGIVPMIGLRGSF